MRIRSLGKNQTELYFPSGLVVFFSYETPVAALIPGKGHYRTNKKHSVTTTRHINKWLDGIPAEEYPQDFFNALVGA